MAKAKHVDQHKVNFEYDLVGDGKNHATLDKIETAAYISDIVLQLRNMAKSADLKFLVYFLEMAFQEAFSQSTRETSHKNGSQEEHSPRKPQG